MTTLQMSIPLSLGCRWFVTADHLGPEARQCGKQCAPESSYCPEHHARAWVPVPKKRPGAVPLRLPGKRAAGREG